MIEFITATANAWPLAAVIIVAIIALTVWGMRISWLRQEQRMQQLRNEINSLTVKRRSDD